MRRHLNSEIVRHGCSEPLLITGEKINNVTRQDSQKTFKILHKISQPRNCETSNYMILEIVNHSSPKPLLVTGQKINTTSPDLPHL